MYLFFDYENCLTFWSTSIYTDQSSFKEGDSVTEVSHASALCAVATSPRKWREPQQRGFAKAVVDVVDEWTRNRFNRYNRQ